MKPVKLTLRIWIAVTSILSFLGGWALLSHSGKPISIFAGSADTTSGGTVSANVTLQPIPSLDQLTANATGTTSSVGIQSLPAQSNATTQSFVPRLRSRGS